MLVLQGGGALGAYQAGAYEALAEAGQCRTGWPASRSAPSMPPSSPATPPEDRVPPPARLLGAGVVRRAGEPALDGTQSRELFNYLSAAYISTVGVPGFFEPRFPPPLVMPARLAGGAEHLRLRPPQGDAGGAGRLRPDRGRARAPERRRGQHPQRQLRLFRFRGPCASRPSTSWRPARSHPACRPS